MRPSVALVAHNVHDRGGMERSLAELVRHAQGRVDFHVVATDLAADLRGEVAWTRIKAPTRPVPALFGAFYAAAGVAVPRLRTDLVHTMGALYPGPADLVSVQFCHRAFAGAAPEHRAVTGTPLRRLNRGLDLRLSAAAERRAYRPGRVARFAAASTGIERELHRHYPGVPVTVVPNGVDRARFAPVADDVRAALRRAFGYFEDDIVALFLGGDWRRKGLAVAVDGVAAAVAGGASGLRLSVVGTGDPEPYREHADASGIADRLQFFGPTTAPQDHLRAADVFVLPTAYEAFPVVALEAAAAGLPIVATAVNGIEDLVVGGRNGILVARDAGSVGDALLRLARDPAARAAMSTAAEASARSYTWAAAAEETVAIYEELVHDRVRG